MASQPPAASLTLPQTRQVEATVVAVLPQFRQAQLRAGDGSLFVLTDATPVRWAEVCRGQRLQCTVTVRLARVVAARILR